MSIPLRISVLTLAAKVKTMTLLLLGILVWLLLGLPAFKYATTRRALNSYDRVAAALFFAVIGLPLFFVGLSLIVQGLTA